MKKPHPLYRWLVVFSLTMGVSLSACCFAQEGLKPPAVEAAVEKMADKAVEKTAIAADSTASNSPQTVAPADLPPPSPTTAKSATEMFSALWNMLDPETLWKKNGIVAWGCLFGYIFAGMVLGKIAAVLLLRIASGREGIVAKIFSDMAGPANLVLVTLGIFLGLHWLVVSDSLKAFSNQVIHLLFTLAVFWYLYNVIGMVDLLLRHLSRNSASALEKQVAPLVRRTLRVFLIILTVMYVFQTVFQKDIGAWLTGLGIAGIAVSLAAQDSLKNLFGSITIILDRPFKIGDRIICTGYEGVIEDIGFRSTKVRTTAGHLVSIPNANVVNSPIENISRRPGIRRSFSLNLPAGLSALKMKQAMSIVRELLEHPDFREPIHAKINGEINVPQVACGDILNDRLPLTVTYWYSPAKPADAALFSEKLTLRILEAFEKAEIPLTAAK